MILKWFRTSRKHVLFSWFFWLPSFCAEGHVSGDEIISSENMVLMVTQIISVINVLGVCPYPLSIVKLLALWLSSSGHDSCHVLTSILGLPTPYFCEKSSCHVFEILIDNIIVSSKQPKRFYNHSVNAGERIPHELCSILPEKDIYYSHSYFIGQN